jgi:hypothetical protein
VGERLTDVVIAAQCSDDTNWLDTKVIRAMRDELLDVRRLLREMFAAHEAEQFARHECDLMADEPVPCEACAVSAAGTAAYDALTAYARSLPEPEPRP